MLNVAARYRGVHRGEVVLQLGYRKKTLSNKFCRNFFFKLDNFESSSLLGKNKYIYENIIRNILVPIFYFVWKAIYRFRYKEPVGDQRDILDGFCNFPPSLLGKDRLSYSTVSLLQTLYCKVTEVRGGHAWQNNVLVVSVLLLCYMYNVKNEHSHAFFIAASLQLSYCYVLTRKKEIVE